MEENKDFFAETENNLTSAETNNDAAETPDEVKGTINVIAGEDGPTAVFTADSTPAKKKTIQTPIIIAGVIVLAFIVAFSIPDCCIPTLTIFEVYVGSDNSVVACNANNINIVKIATQDCFKYLNNFVIINPFLKWFLY